MNTISRLSLGVLGMQFLEIFVDFKDFEWYSLWLVKGLRAGGALWNSKMLCYPIVDTEINIVPMKYANLRPVIDVYCLVHVRDAANQH